MDTGPAFNQRAPSHSCLGGRKRRNGIEHRPPPSAPCSARQVAATSKIDNMSNNNDDDLPNPHEFQQMRARLLAQRTQLRARRAFDGDRLTHLVGRQLPLQAEHPLLRAVIARDWIDDSTESEDHAGTVRLISESVRHELSQHPWPHSVPASAPALTQDQGLSIARLLLSLRGS